MLEQVNQTQALLSMMRNAQQQQQQLQLQQQQQQLKQQQQAAVSRKRAADNDAIDLTDTSPPLTSNSSEEIEKKRQKSGASVDGSLCNLVTPCSHEAKEVKMWSVEDVCKFVASVETCQSFVEVTT